MAYGTLTHYLVQVSAHGPSIWSYHVLPPLAAQVDNAIQDGDGDLLAVSTSHDDSVLTPSIRFRHTADTCILIFSACVQELVSFQHPHVQNQRLQVCCPQGIWETMNIISVCRSMQVNYEGQCQNFEPPYDEMIAAHIGYDVLML